MAFIFLADFIVIMGPAVMYWDSGVMDVVFNLRGGMDRCGAKVSDLYCCSFSCTVSALCGVPHFKNNKAIVLLCMSILCVVNVCTVHVLQCITCVV